MTNEGFISMFRRGIKINVIGDSIAAGAGASDSVKSDEEIITTEKRTYCRRYGEKSWYGLFEKYIKDKFLLIILHIVRYFKEKNKKIILMTGLPSTVQNESFPNRLYHNEEALIF